MSSFGSNGTLLPPMSANQMERSFISPIMGAQPLSMRPRNSVVSLRSVSIFPLSVSGFRAST